MAELPRSEEILIPRWVQLVVLPLIVLGAWQVLVVVNHAVFIFVIAALIAILLNPIVRAFCAMRVPRGAGGAAGLPAWRRSSARARS